MANPSRIAYLLADGGIPLLNSQKGGSIHARAMAHAFQSEGAEVEMVVMRRGKGPDRDLKIREAQRGKGGKWLHKILTERAKGHFNWPAALACLIWQYDFLVEARRLLLKFPADFLYARHAWLAYPYARLAREFKVPLVLEGNALLSIEKSDRGEMAFPGFTRSIERGALESASLILPVSAELKSQIESLGIDPAKIVVTPNGVDLELFHPAPPALKKREVFRIGSASSFKAYHGLSTLLDAAARLRDDIPGLRLRLIGDGEVRPDLERRAEDLGIRHLIEFTGTVDHERIPDLMRECDVSAAPYEGPHNQYNCPMKLFESMAMKLPIVASAWGDIPNVLEHERTALLHAPGDPASLAAMLLRVYLEPAEAARRAEAAYAVALDRSWRSTARRILDWQAKR